MVLCTMKTKSPTMYFEINPNVFGNSSKMNRLGKKIERYISR